MSTGDARGARARLLGLTNYERTRPDGARDFHLERTRELLERLGRPDVRLGGTVAQVAGTKGKGSVARFLDSIYRAAGLRTGRFLSPHLERIEERICLDGAALSPEAFDRHAEAVLEADPGGLTFFEATLGIACLAFAEAEVEATVLEVGLGGRLDATTAVPVTQTVITQISFDHTELLGRTLREIAGEKAGIARPGVPLISGVDPAAEPGRVIADRAASLGAPFRYVPPAPAEAAGLAGVRWDGLLLPVLGKHQAHNAALAAAVAGEVDRAAVRRGLVAARHPACCEYFPGPPPALLDGAHNEASIGATLRALADHLPGARPVLLFAVAGDKDRDTMIRLLAAAVGPVVCTRADARRGVGAAELARHPAWSGRALALEDPAAALARARAEAGAGGLVLVTGSLYLAGAIRTLLRARA
ncbi:MAG: bifunctional folylpolyglutamate synthase/dihydrofolate synthase [Planctomycetaceae bacterium]